MKDTMLWLVGGAAFAVVVAAFVWVLRHRDDAAAPEHHSYDAPEVTITGEQRRSALAFGATEVEEPVDETVPLSRLGGAGWRDGGGLETPPTTGYAGQSRSRDSSSAAVVPERDVVPGADVAADLDTAPTRHVMVDEQVADRTDQEAVDRERGGHW
ncbi:hypothetical protein [Knoellia subterranea]|uniref:Uncharacterized protein n=1 Tax=Knoellia subterranea KCTC 19937 TaxID=1385521 RepID=A0A0A0JKL5_9MICO|nr:hypothetical protein [Knoellia subterranea]KGN37314.1 hypothetical protein N803_15650 [Knoellia subterranea KCTC 19937]